MTAWLSRTTATQNVSQWQRVVLLVAALQPDLGSVYSCTSRAVINRLRVSQSVDGALSLARNRSGYFLFGVGYAIAATNPGPDWSVRSIGLIAKILEPLRGCGQ